MENASIQVGHENRLFDLIHHVVGCKHHKSHITRQWYLHILRANAREDYANGYALYAFDLTAGKQASIFICPINKHKDIISVSAKTITSVYCVRVAYAWL